MSFFAKTSRFIQTAFPERQIYHRSDGVVRYFNISTFQQVIIAIGVTAVSLWFIFASASVLFMPPSISISNSDGEVLRLERWVQELRANDELSRSQLEARSAEFDTETSRLQERHSQLEAMFDAFKNDSMLDTSVLEGNMGSILIDPSTAEADPRQSQHLAPTSGGLSTSLANDRVQAIYNDQQLFLDRLEDRAAERAEAAFAVLQLTKTDLSENAQLANMGGPLISLEDFNADQRRTPEEAEFDLRLIQVASRMEEARRYSSLLENLPLAAPVGIAYRVTSNFGPRMDPISNRPGWHHGIDIGASWDAPIVAAGPGRVIFAGRKTGYGKVVDIDHGQGYISRYAHLNRIKTQRGDIVAVGDDIGSMGSSGRSTGPHLHYEIFINGKRYNPVEFLKAGKHVYEE